MTSLPSFPYSILHPSQIILSTFEHTARRLAFEAAQLWENRIKGGETKERAWNGVTVEMNRVRYSPIDQWIQYPLRCHEFILVSSWLVVSITESSLLLPLSVPFSLIFSLFISTMNALIWLSISLRYQSISPDYRNPSLLLRTVIAMADRFSI